MDATEKQQLYLRAQEHFRNNELDKAFAEFDELGGYRDSYTYLGFISMKHPHPGVTLEFTAQCFALEGRRETPKPCC